MAHAFTDSDIDQLKGGAGSKLYGDGALVVLKALLESGVSYFGGYPGAPTANLLDAVADAYEPVLKDYGMYFESSSNEMAAAAMLAASVYEPVRGAVTWKVLGNGVATDVVDHVSQLGVKDGAMIIVGEDYGGSSTTVLQRTLPWAAKAGLVTIDPRGDQQLLHRMGKEGMDLSRDSQSVVALLLRPHLSHANSEIVVGDNLLPKISTVHKLKEFRKDPTLFALPPYSFQQEKSRFETRLPTAARLVAERKLNEFFGNRDAKVGLITHGTTYNTVLRLLSLMGLADEFGALDPRLHLLQLNVIHPLNDDQLADFMSGKSHVLLIEEGQPELLELYLRALLQKRSMSLSFSAHDRVPKFGELSPEKLALPLAGFVEEALGFEGPVASMQALLDRKQQAGKLFPKPVPPRLPTFCSGCPERPVFSQMKIDEYNTGVKHWHAGDVGCYGMAGYMPFEMADSNIGMGGGLAAASAVSALSEQKNVSVVGDGTLWHSAFNTSAANAIYNKQDATYVVLDNKWTAMTGAHENPNVGRLMNGEAMNATMSIPATFKAMGVKRIETANPYKFKEFQAKLKKIHKDAGTPQVRVLISEAECALQAQRHIRPAREEAIKVGKRVEIERLGVDEEVCVGDHACMRFNGCPSLSLKDGPNPLRTAPVASIDKTCIGCGVCGEISTAAQLCPSFYKVTKIENAGLLERWREAISRWLIPAKRGAPKAPPTAVQA